MGVKRPFGPRFWVTIKALWKSLIVGLLAGWFSANKPTIKPTNGLVVTILEGYMDYGDIVTRAWRITWNNKYLWVLGFLAALTSVSSNGNSFNYSFDESDIIDPAQAMQMGAMALGLVCIFMFIGLAFWVLSVAARGGLISGVSRIDDGEKLTLGEAFGAGTAAIWRLLGVYILAYLPLILVGLVIGVVVATVIGGSIAMTMGIAAGATQNPEELLAGTAGLMILCLCLLVCALIPVSFILYYVAEFGVRATMIQKMGVSDSLRQGWQVFRANLSPVILLSLLLFVVSLVVSMAMGIVLLPLSLLVFGPAIFSTVSSGSMGMGGLAWTIGGGVCLGIIGAMLLSVFQTWVSAVWTLAYKEFISKKPAAKESYA
jgi:hypothetical protein